jgi:hypothetical protein
MFTLFGALRAMCAACLSRSINRRVT